MIINNFDVNIYGVIKSEKTVSKIADKICEMTGCDHEVAERIANEKRKEYKRKESNAIIFFVLGVLSILPMDFFSFIGAIVFFCLSYAIYPRNDMDIKQSEKTGFVNSFEEKEAIKITEERINELRLINCPCCGREISNMSETCIHCGQPINIGVKDSSSRKNTSLMICPVCKSNNINVSVDNVPIGYNGKSELRKKSVITNTANSAGRLGMIMMTGGLWALTPKKSKYKEIQKRKTSYMKIKTCVCQNCGYSWNK